MKYRVTQARADLDSIFAYWAGRATLETAERLIDGIMERFWLIGEHPNAGQAVEDLAEGMKCFPAGKYLIYYRKRGRSIEILHIFHGARDQGKASRQKVKRKR